MRAAKWVRVLSTESPELLVAKEPNSSVELAALTVVLLEGGALSVDVREKVFFFGSLIFLRRALRCLLGWSAASGDSKWCCVLVTGSEELELDDRSEDSNTSSAEIWLRVFCQHHTGHLSDKHA